MSKETRNPYALHQPAGGSGSYLKFEDGKTVRVRIVSNPVIFDSLYKGQATTKYAWLVVNLDEVEVQIMQLPGGGYRGVAAIGADEEWGNPLENEYDLKITRTGQKQQTKYSVVAVNAKVEIDDELQEQIEGIDLVQRLSASPNAERVAWVFDEIDGKRPEKTQDPVIEDVEDEPIDLDDLPV